MSIFTSRKARLVAAASSLTLLSAVIYAFNAGDKLPTAADDRANTTTLSAQQAAAVARDAAGDYVIVWSGNGTQAGNIDTAGIFFQRYNAKGAKVGTETLVNGSVSATQGNPAVAMDASGNFVVAWESDQAETTAGVETPSGKGIWMRRFNANGVAQGTGEAQVNSYTASDQQLPAVAMAPTGEFVIAWQSLSQDGSGQGIYAQRYDASGVAQGAEFRANTTTANSQRNPSVAMDGSAGFVIVWESTLQAPDSDGTGIFGQVYSADGTPQSPGADISINSITTGSQTNPSVSRALDGKFVVAWTGPDADTTGIFARRFDSTGGPVDAQDFAVNSTTTGTQEFPSVALDASGDFFVAWDSNAGGTFDIIARRYSAAATAGGEGEITANAGTGDQTLPAVAVDADGDAVVAWQGNGTGDTDGVFARRLVGPEDVNLGIALVDSPDPGTPGGNMTYTITVTNQHAAATSAGVGSAANVSVSGTLPANITLPAISATSDWTCPASPTGSNFTCTLNASLAAAATTGAITVTFKAPVTTTNHTITGSATVSEDQVDSVSADNTATANTSICNATENIGTLAVTNTSAAESAGTGAVTVTRSGGTCGALSVTVSVGNGGTASSPADYTTTLPKTLSWADGETGAKSVTPAAFTVVEDTAYETDETVVLALSNPNPTTATTNGTFTITDNDAAPSLAIADKSQAEGNSASAPMPFTVTLTPAPGTTIQKDISVNFATSDGTGAAGTNATTADGDYAAASGTLTFNCATTPCTGSVNNTRTANVTINGDTKDENDENFTVTLSAQTPAAVTLADATATGTITTDDSQPTVQFGAATSQITETNATQTLNVPVTLSTASSRTVTVQVSYAGTATGPGTGGTNDYNSPGGTNPTTITFNPGETSKNLALSIVGDTVDEPDETIQLSLSAPTSATLGTQVTHTATIVDDDAAPAIGFTLATDSTTGDRGQVVNVTVSLPAQGSGKTVQVNYAVTGGTATPTTDYTLSPSPGVLTFAPGTTSQTIAVTVVNDSLNENNETIDFALSNPVNATLGSAAPASPTEELTIVNDNAEDPLPTVSFDLATSSASEAAGTKTVTLTLNPVSGRTVTVPFTVNAGGAQPNDATPDVDFTVTPNPNTITIPAGQTTATITVNIVNDSTNEPDEKVRLGLGTLTNATAGAQSTHVLTILNDDTLPQASFTSAAQSVSEGVGTTTVTVQLSRPADSDVILNYNLSGTALNGTDYTVSPASPFVIAQGESSKVLTVTVTDDANVESDETAVLTLANPTNATLVNPQSHTVTIVNNDTAGVTVTQSGGTTDVVEGATDGTQTDTYTLVLTSKPTANVSIAPNSTGQVTVTSLVTFTPSNWNVPQTVTVTAVNDSTPQGNRTDTITHSVSSADANYSGIAVSNVVAHIQDDDVAGVLIQQTGGGTSVTEGGATDTYSLVLSAQPTQDVTVHLAPDAQVTVSGATLSGGNLTFTNANWNVAQSVTVTAVDDLNAEGTHTGTIMHTTSSADNAFNNLAVADLVAQITDNDTAGVVLSKTTASATEGGAGDTYKVHLSSQPVNDVTVTLTPDSQVSVSPTQIVFNSVNWNLDVTVNVSAVDDTKDEPSPNTGIITHSVTAQASDALYNGIAVPNVTVSVTDNDAPPTVTLGLTGSPMAEDLGSATVTATLSAVSGQDVTVDFAFSGTATNGSDYTRSASSVTIPAGSLSGSITLNSLNDNLDEADETVIVDISNVTNGTESGTQQVTAVITDDDPPPSVTLGLTGSPFAESGGTATVTATLSAVSGQAVTVNLGYSGTASNPGDYTASGTSIVIPAGSTTGSVTLTGVDDTLNEPTETVVVDITTVTNGTEAGTQQVVANIADDDPAPTVALSLTGSPIAENGGVGTVTATLSAASGQPVTVNLAYSGTAGSPADYTASAASIVIPAGQTTGSVTITAVDDTLDEPNETVVVDITTVTNGTEAGTQQVTAVIADDDAAPTVTLSLTGSPIAENGGVGTVTATLSAASSQDVTVNLAYSGTATPTSDYTRSGTSIVIPAGSTTGSVTITGVNDTLDEPDETVVVDISGVTNGTESGTQQVTATITDDDAPPTVTLSKTGDPVSEASGVAHFVATLSAASSQDVTVTLALSGTATDGIDYTHTGTSILIPAGGTSGTLQITAVNDTKHEGDETIVADITAVTNGTENGTQQQTMTITDNDAAPSGGGGSFGLMSLWLLVPAVARRRRHLQR